MSMTTVPVSEIEQTTHAALVAHGADHDVAGAVASAVAASESVGNKICGLYYVESYCTQLESGRVNGSAQPEVTQPRPGAVVVDGKLGFAQPAFAAGFETACGVARTNGICGFSVGHTHTCTSLGYFTEQFAVQGLLAIGATNASPRVAAPGGNRPLLGTNPIAMAVPGPGGEVAFQFDFATSAVALGTITKAAAAGEDIPLGWAVDTDGKPTTDPSAAVQGSLASAGGYKGFGIGLMVEVLAAGLTGSNASVDVPPLKTQDGPPHDLGQFYLVIDPDAYSQGGLAQLLAGLGASLADQPGARLPGSARQPADQVEVEADLWQRIVGLGAVDAG